MSAPIMQGSSLTPRDLTFLVEKIFPFFRKLIRIGYFSLEVKGANHIPRKGSTIYVGNHSGWFTLDTFIAALALWDVIGSEQLPYIVVHDLLFKVPGLRSLLKDINAIPVSWLYDFNSLPQGIDAFGIYPEGVDGNCKPFWHAYQMREWKKGFVRLGITRQANIVPIAIIGGEECLPGAGSTKLLKPLIGSIMPVPLVSFPLPTRWQVIFHKPIDLSRYPPSAASDRRLCARIATKTQQVVQETLDKETPTRPIVRLANLVSRLKRKPHPH